MGMFGCTLTLRQLMVHYAYGLVLEEHSIERGGGQEAVW